MDANAIGIIIALISAVGTILGVQLTSNKKTHSRLEKMEYMLETLIENTKENKKAIERNNKILDGNGKLGLVGQVKLILSNLDIKI